MSTQALPPSPLDAGDPSTVIKVEDDRTGLSAETLARAFTDHLTFSQAKTWHTATDRDRFLALALAVRDRLVHRWIHTQQTYYRSDPKRVYYLSLEYLMGRALGDTMLNLGLYDAYRAVLGDLGLDVETLRQVEPDPGLGNGGLGRLAACFLDSMATLALPCYGYGIRYEFGIFDQLIRDGWQVERPDEWLRFGNPWEIERPEYTVRVRFGGQIEWSHAGAGGDLRATWVGAKTVLGVPYDTPIAGFGNDTVNTLRLWSARASEEFDLSVFNAGDYERAVEDKNASETISKVLYPNDNVMQGRELRLKQEYFFVACSVQDIVRRYRRAHQTFDAFPDKVALQLNDTHPSLAVAELMRVLVDENDLTWDKAWDITQRSIAYTNHTLLPEALEKWPVPLFEQLLPRHLQIIYEVNRRFLRAVLNAHPFDHERARRMSLVEEGEPRQVRMAHLAVVGSHSVNGVAELHTRLLKSEVLRDFNEMYPERFNNKTNGVTPRRWLLCANPRLAALVTEAIGPAWVTDLDQLRRLEPLADDAAFRRRVRDVKRDNKLALARYFHEANAVDVDVDSLFDVQIKRLHEYKRQLLNVLHIVALFNRAKREGLDAVGVPRTFVFGAKAAPGYVTAKLIIKLINSVAQVVNGDAGLRGRLKVVFAANYRVSLAEKIFPASDLSEQISTAGKEASGTGNMKFALNGALTIGTLDGANIEIREEVGAENFFLFGLTAEEVAERKLQGYQPWRHYDENPELRAVLDLIRTGFFSPEQPQLFEGLVDDLVKRDQYMLLADFASYAEAQQRVSRAFQDPEAWTRMAILNIARMGKFSSDRAISQYAAEIWGATAVPVA
ncbi:MAG TPA: glycogen/starch/alpha-glucan phosphorylase [Myxococcota bacterium]|jgi:starch phosphorylase|nr:glycogen/starch/alpha-glucan phosphorylase [Myxococcota bacterium]